MGLLDNVISWLNGFLLRVAGVSPVPYRRASGGDLAGDLPDRTRRGAQAGYVTAEYAVGIIAAVAFAGVLLAVIKSGAVKGLLTGIVETALSL